MVEIGNFMKPPHVETTEILSHEIPVSQVRVNSELAAAILEKHCGLYITIETGPLTKAVDYKKICSCLVDQLSPLLSPFFGKVLCICGIGNHRLAHDSLGPEVVQRFLPKIYDTMCLQSNFKQIVACCPGVIAQTNVPAETLIFGIVDKTEAVCLLTIDACACKDVDRLCGSIQLSDGGLDIHSGSSFLHQSTIGIPVISVGVPTLISAQYFVRAANQISF